MPKLIVKKPNNSTDLKSYKSFSAVMSKTLIVNEIVKNDSIISNQNIFKKK